MKEINGCVFPETVDEISLMSDNELLAVVEKRKSKDTEFYDFWQCDGELKYNKFTYELQKRGYRNGYYLPVENQKKKMKEIKIENVDNKVRQSLTMSADVAEEWKQFTKKFPFPTQALDVALTDFMKACESEEYKFYI